MLALEKKNFHTRDSRLKFNKYGHTYSTKECPYLRSVSKVISSQFPAFDKMKVSKKLENTGNYKGMTALQIRKMWESAGKEARESGTVLHDQIEKYYNGVEVEADESDVAVDYFLEWDADHEDWEVYRTEWKIFDETLKIAGTIDAVFIDENGEFVLVDWKRCKEIKKGNRFESALGKGLEHIPDCNFAKYSMQLNIYKLILEKNYGISVSKMFIVNIHPAQSSYCHIEAMDMTDELKLVFGSNESTEIEPAKTSVGIVSALESGKEVHFTGTFMLSKIK
jgi:ATP-dependent exoDNAse (exonuclease V) beta subunit